MAIALAAGAMDVHMQRHPSLTHHPRARPPPDDRDGALSIGVFSVDELLWTCRPTDPTTLQHQKGCRLFERQERMFFARPGREIIRAGYRPEDVVEGRQKQPSMSQMQIEQAGLPQADFEMYAEAGMGAGALGDESDALGMLVDGHHNVGHGHDPRQRDRERNDALLVQQVQQAQLASGEHPAQVSMAMPVPRTRQPAASRRSSGASSRAMSPAGRTEDRPRMGRAEAGVGLALGEPSPFVAGR
ncbi:hypothetical protein EIP86_006058 [Pleurotus ostreatoroseus]|nr:hypothetical protein EIP86_006058 [Pleurotus ostreatoroseus]